MLSAGCAGRLGAVRACLTAHRARCTSTCTEHRARAPLERCVRERRHEVRRHVGRRSRRDQPPDRHRPAAAGEDAAARRSSSCRRCPASPTRWSRSRSWPRTARSTGGRRRCRRCVERHLSVATRGDERRAGARCSRTCGREFDELIGLVHALAVLREVSPRSRDAVHAVGELVSSRIVAAAFADHGMPSAWVDARTRADHRRRAQRARRPT